jgi:hypothetical protein
MTSTHEIEVVLRWSSEHRAQLGFQLPALSSQLPEQYAVQSAGSLSSVVASDKCGEWRNWRKAQAQGPSPRRKKAQGARRLKAQGARRRLKAQGASASARPQGRKNATRARGGRWELGAPGAKMECSCWESLVLASTLGGGWRLVGSQQAQNPGPNFPNPNNPNPK